jgi:hypothetical protein
MPYDAAQLIATLPADMRAVMVAGATNATVGRASVSAENMVTLYGEDNQYTASYWIDVAQVTLPAVHSRVTIDGESRLVLGTRSYPGDLRRIDVGGEYGRG